MAQKSSVPAFTPNSTDSQLDRAISIKLTKLLRRLLDEEVRMDERSASWIVRRALTERYRHRGYKI
ncbi:ribbon-helix-helix protein, CopG family [Nitrospira sp. Nam74]